MGVYKPLFAPLQPSGLRILSGPVSPASPLSPLRSQLHFPLLPSARAMPSSSTFGSISTAVAASPETMPWIWSCHKCHARYPLGATRRCLHDGHFFCGGTTVDKVTRKVKRHRACASEFDYLGWEDFGNWKRHQAEHRPMDKSHKNCEHQCDFPSACHWKARHAPKKDANFEFLDPKSLGTEPNASSAPEKTSMPSLKKTGVYIDKLVRAAEKRTNQLTTLLSTIEEERNFTSMPGYIASPTGKPPKLPELPQMNGLGLNFPVMDFSSFKKPLNEHHDSTGQTETDTTPPEVPTPELSVIINTTEDDDVDMTDWLSEDTTSSPLVSPTSKLDPYAVPFDFGIEPGHGPQASLVKDLSPVSPRRNAWDWTAGDIGIALGSPTKPIFEDSWDEPMGGDMDDEHTLWERELAMVDRRLSV